MMYGLLPESNVNPTHFPSALFHTRKGSIPAGPKQRRRSSEAESTAFLFSVPSAPAPSLQPGRPEQEQEVRPCFHPADTPVGRYRSLLRDCRFSIDGLDVPVSHFVTACRDTSSFSDTSAWDSPSLFRKQANFFSRVIVYISKSIPARNESKPRAAYFPATNGCQLGFLSFF